MVLSILICWYSFFRYVKMTIVLSMASLVDVDVSQTRHEKLSNFIKSVHSNLRKDVQNAHGDFQSVWTDHCKNINLLKEYSSAMKELAVEHWAANNLRRIEWCKEICLEYFREGGYEKCMRKDSRRILFNPDKHQNCDCGIEVKQVELLLTRDPSSKLNRLLLLDVGSCFNPFQAYPEIFTPLAIDLCPADKTVFACDFLNLVTHSHDDLNEVKNAVKDLSDCSTSVEQAGYQLPDNVQKCIFGDKVKELPESTFNVVVFCLLLSYLPAREQRWECCKKAHKLLKDGGLLIIITPDSSHQNKNVRMVKSWKTAIESIGFVRWKYCKDDHTHCMAFRKKTLCRNLLQEQEKLGTPLSEMLYINQDLQDCTHREQEMS